jgi:methylenetetrahydrofolate--tRNA-(uracil-5-)-methyltransferase
MATAIDMGDIAWAQSRYDKVGPGGDGADYINCPMDKEQYEAFVDALLAGPSRVQGVGERPYFDGCLPIEVMAERGRETLRFGPMKPVGLTNPRTRPSSPTPSSSCGRTMRWARCGTWSASRPS